MNGEGSFNLGDTAWGLVVTQSFPTLTNTQADALPRYRVFGDGNPMPNGSGSCSQAWSRDIESVTRIGLSGSDWIYEVTVDSTQLLAVNDRVYVDGNDIIDGTWPVTSVESTTAFRVALTSDVGASGNGGTAAIAGLYKWEHAVPADDGYEAGKTYQVIVTATITYDPGDGDVTADIAGATHFNVV